jgi:hypothetical protein
MNSDPFVLIDRERRRVFGWLAEARRPFHGASVTTDGDGVPWTWTHVGDSAVGITWYGPGRVWDRDWAEANADEVARCRESVRAAPPHAHRVRLEEVASGLRLGDLARRVLYAVHRAVLVQKTSLVKVSDGWLAETCWGTGRATRPKHWRSVLREILRGLSWLHVADRVPDGPPSFGPQSVLITHAGDLRGMEHDECPGDCGDRGHAHHHFEVDIGPGFLGLLERFGQVDGAGVRRYQFPVSGKRAATTLRGVGKSGRLVSAFVPAVLGEPGRCRTVDPGSHRILQALVRETTRPSKPQSDADPRAEVLTGGLVKTWSGRTTIRCKLLGHDRPLVGFNGNGKRKAMGFRLTGEWGWLPKAGYPADAIPAFLDDLAAVAEPLSLTVIGVGPSNTLYTLSQLRGMAESAAGRRQLDRLDVRVFAPAEYASRWAAYFGWADPVGRVADRPEFDLLAEMRSRQMSCRGVAAGVGCDHSFLSRVLKGTKSWPPGLLDKVRAYVAAGPVGVPADGPIVRPGARTGKLRCPAASGRSPGVRRKGR